MSLLDVRDLDAGYGDLQVLYGVDLAVAEGEYVAIVGPNGAGKSTAMKAVIGLATRMGGTIEFDSADITGLEPQEIVDRGVGYVPQTGNVFPSLTVEENLAIGGYLLGGPSEERLDAVIEQFPVLGERLDARAGNLSGGQQQMLAMARALIPDPPLLLLDEPSAGLAPDLVDDMFDHRTATPTTATRCSRIRRFGVSSWVGEGPTLWGELCVTSLSSLSPARKPPAAL